MNPTRPLQPTRCGLCDHLDAVSVCRLCGTERPAYAKLRAALKPKVAQKETA